MYIITLAFYSWLIVGLQSYETVALNIIPTEPRLSILAKGTTTSDIEFYRFGKIDSDTIQAKTINNKNIYLLEGPSFNAKKLIKVGGGEEIVLVQKYKNFYKAIYKGTHGFIMDSFVEQSEVVAQMKLFDDSNSNSLSQQGSKQRRSTGSSRQSVSKRYHKGPRGGCYYLSNSGKKVYVSRSLCN